MKRLVLAISAIIFPFFLGACQEQLEWEIELDIATGGVIEPKDDEETVTYEEIMRLTGDRPQGGDCWGNYFVQFVTGNSFIRIYDLSLKTLVQTVKIPSYQQGFVSNCHCNTVCFGTEFYDANDSFPLIYVSTGYASGGYSGALVYRIVEQNGTFSIALVQTVKFPEDKSSWTEFVPAGEFAYLCYTSERVIFKVKMPQLKDGNIIISRDDALKTYQFTPQPDWMATSRNQDRLFYQGKMLFVSGVPQMGEASAFVVLNLDELTRERIIDFKKIGLRNESESLFVWQGDICVAFVDKIVKLHL